MWKRRSRPFRSFIFTIYIVIFSWRIFNVSNILISISFRLFLLWLLLLGFDWFFNLLWLLLFNWFGGFLVGLFIFYLDLGFVCLYSLIGHFFGNDGNSCISFDCLIRTLLCDNGRILIRFRKLLNYLWGRLRFLLFVSGFWLSFILGLFLFWLLLRRSWWLFLLLGFGLLILSILDFIVFLFLLKETECDNIKDIPQHVS